MRVAMYHCRLPQPGVKPGGVEVYVDRLASAMQSRGHEVTLFTFAPPAAPRDYEVAVMGPRRAKESRLLRQYVTPWMFNRRPFDPRRFDVVHMHGDDWFWFDRRLPSVRTFYGSALLEALSATSVKRRVNQGIVFGLELLAKAEADAVYGIGPDSRMLYAADGVLPCGIDTARPRGPKAERPTVLFVGTWQGRKRGAALQRAFVEHVLPAVPDAELVMVSDHADPAPGVRLVKAPSDEVLQELYAQAWAFCLPSSYEGFGIPYVEAMAAGTPVVATPNPGAEQVLGGGRFGSIVELDGVGRRLRELLLDPAERSRLSSLGLRRAEDFAWPAVIDQHIAAYELAIGRWAQRRRSTSVDATQPSSLATIAAHENSRS